MPRGWLPETDGDRFTDAVVPPSSVRYTSPMHVLVVDDEPLLARAISKVLARENWEVDVSSSATSALRQLDRVAYDAVILDVYLRDGDGWPVLRAAQKLQNPPAVVMMSGGADVRMAVEAIRRGARDLLPKPIDLKILADRVARLLESRASARRWLEPSVRGAPVAASTAMKRVFDLADRVARSPSASALILGESGVGKELVASRIHASSKRSARPFVRVNLAAIADSMVEAELFGSVRGSFTDAKRDRKGLFATADSGTILLDELCEFRLGLQAKLLRALEERRFFPVGSDEERTVDVRVLAATNRDPEEAIKSGALREDLYYRLSSVVIWIPPLRERPEDILPLARSFLETIARLHGRPAMSFTVRAERAMLDLQWRGNARELRNVVEHAVLVTDVDEVGEDAIVSGTSARWRVSTPMAPDPAEPPPTDLVSALQVDTRERVIIEETLRKVGGSRTRAAAILGISRTTLWEKVKRYGIE